MSNEEPRSEPNPGEQKNLSPTESDAIIEKADGPKMLRRMEQFSAMMQFSPGRDPLVEKMSPEHVTAVIANKDKDGERKHTEELANICSQRWYFGGGIAFILLICFYSWHTTRQNT